MVVVVMIGPVILVVMSDCTVHVILVLNVQVVLFESDDFGCSSDWSGGCYV